MRSAWFGVLLVVVLAGCGSGATEDFVASDGLECDSDARKGWAFDYASEAVPSSDSPEDAVRDAVDVDDARLVVGEERDRDDVVSVDVIVEPDGRADMRVEVWQTEGGWVADNVRACG